MRAWRRWLPWLVCAALLAACGSESSRPASQGRRDPRRTVSIASLSPANSAPHPAGPRGPLALMTAELENHLVVVALPSGRVIRRVSVPAGPEYVAVAGGGQIVVSSGRAGEVSLLDPTARRVTRTLGGFESPHILAISPDGAYLYVTDDARGTLTAIRLSDVAVTEAVPVGIGAHHMAISPDGRQLWVALGESASTIVMLSTVHPGSAGSGSAAADPGRPRVVGHFDPGFAAHDLAFSPDGRDVWISSATGPDVAVFSARTHRLIGRVPVGPGPQHIDFHGPYAYLTSGYGGTIEQVDANTLRVLRRASGPYGSFELDVGNGYVVTASLLRGTLAIYTPQLRLLGVHTLTSASRDVAISDP